MTAPDDVPRPFDESVVASVAADCDASADELASLVDRHQRSVADLPGVENLVYEWRKAHDGAVLERTPTAYYCSVPERVWDEFAGAMDLSAAERDALVAAHREQVRRRPDCPDDPGPGRTVVVLRRDVD